MKIEAYILKYINAKRNMKFLSLYLCKTFFWRIQKNTWSRLLTGREKTSLRKKYSRLLNAKILLKTVVLTSLSSSSKVNSFFLTCFSWLRKLNSAAFFWSLANLFSYLDTFFRVGFMLQWNEINEKLCNKVYDSPRRKKNVLILKTILIIYDKIKKEYLQFTSEIVDLAVQVRDLHVSNISINIHYIRYCDMICSCVFSHLFFLIYKVKEKS